MNNRKHRTGDMDIHSGEIHDLDLLLKDSLRSVASEQIDANQWQRLRARIESSPVKMRSQVRSYDFERALERWYINGSAIRRALVDLYITPTLRAAR